MADDKKPTPQTTQTPATVPAPRPDPPQPDTGATVTKSTPPGEVKIKVSQ